MLCVCQRLRDDNNDDDDEKKSNILENPFCRSFGLNLYEKFM